MANQKILDQKQSVINEITDKVKNSTTFVVFNNNGLNVAELTELRRKLALNGKDVAGGGAANQSILNTIETKVIRGQIIQNINMFI